jgi:hypothetical protein
MMRAILGGADNSANIDGSQQKIREVSLVFRGNGG